jgi:hypothetical protein
MVVASVVWISTSRGRVSRSPLSSLDLLPDGGVGR